MAIGEWPRISDTAAARDPGEPGRGATAGRLPLAADRVRRHHRDRRALRSPQRPTFSGGRRRKGRPRARRTAHAAALRRRDDGAFVADLGETAVRYLLGGAPPDPAPGPHYPESSRLRRDPQSARSRGPHRRAVDVHGVGQDVPWATCVVQQAMPLPRCAEWSGTLSASEGGPESSWAVSALVSRPVADHHPDHRCSSFGSFTPVHGRSVCSLSCASALRRTAADALRRSGGHGVAGSHPVSPTAEPQIRGGSVERAGPPLARVQQRGRRTATVTTAAPRRAGRRLALLDGTDGAVDVGRDGARRATQVLLDDPGVGIGRQEARGGYGSVCRGTPRRPACCASTSSRTGPRGP